MTAHMLTTVLVTCSGPMENSAFVSSIESPPNSLWYIEYFTLFQQERQRLFLPAKENVPRRVGAGCFGSCQAFFARSQRAVKAAGSWIAVSESILRFMSTPASFRPCMKVE